LDSTHMAQLATRSARANFSWVPRHASGSKGSPKGTTISVVKNTVRLCSQSAILATQGYLVLRLLYVWGKRRRDLKDAVVIIHRRSRELGALRRRPTQPPHAAIFCRMLRLCCKPQTYRISRQLCHHAPVVFTMAAILIQDVDLQDWLHSRVFHKT
jgi:hypothetical protein